MFSIHLTTSTSMLFSSFIFFGLASLNISTNVEGDYSTTEIKYKKTKFIEKNNFIFKSSFKNLKLN